MKRFFIVFLGVAAIGQAVDTGIFNQGNAGLRGTGAGAVTGTGTANTLTDWTGSSTIGNATGLTYVSTPSIRLDVSGTISATFARLSSSTTACASSADVGQIVRNPAKNTYAICVSALAVAPLVTSTVISPSAL